MEESCGTEGERALVTGARGLLGSALIELGPEGLEVAGVDLAEGDLSEQETARELLAWHAPRVVLHCAGFTDVDGCTRDPELAQRHNALATRNVARVCQELGARLLMVSTDYVFDGTREVPYAEEDLPNPVNVYGESKLAAERLAAAEVGDLVIARTQWLFGPGGRNFVAAVVHRARNGGPLRVVEDQWGCPTYTRDLAPALWRLALCPAPQTGERAQGVVHVTNSGVTSWAELAEFALRTAGLEEAAVERIRADEWPSPTRRPRWSVLENRRWARLGWPPLRCWAEACEEYVREYLCEAAEGAGSS